MSTVIGNLRVVLGLDAAAFQQGLSKAQAGLKNVGRNMADIGRSMSVGITAPIAAFGGLSLKAAGDFEAAMNRVRAATGASAKEMEALEAIALKMGETTQFKATEAAAAVEMLAKNGLDASQIIGGALEASMLLAASSGSDLASAGDLATDVMLQFGKTAQEMTGLVDGMTGVMLASKFGFDDYRLAIAQAGGVAGGLGVTFEDFNAAIAGTSSLFASGSDAGTSFKTFLQRLVPASKPAAAAMEKLNLEFFNADGSMKSMAEVAQELQEGLEGLSDEARNDALSTIFGTDAMRTAIGLAEQGADGIDRLKDTIGDASATEQAEARLAGFNGEMLKLKSAVEALMIAIGNSGILEWATGLAQQFTALILRLKETNPELLKWGVILGGVAAALGPVLAGIGMMLIGMGPLLTGIKMLVVAAAALGGPFTLAALAITAAAAAIYTNWESVGPWFAELMGGLKRVIQGFADLLSSIATGDMPGAVEAIKAIWDGYREYWTTLWAGIVGVIRWAWEEVIKPITDKLGMTDEIIKGWQRVQAGLETALDAIGSAFDRAMARIQPVVDAAKWVLEGNLGEAINRVTGASKGPISSGPYTGGATGPVLPGTSVPMDMRSGLQNGTAGMRAQGEADAQAYDEGFREGMGIQSPSKVMEEAGHYIMQGLSSGIMQQQPKVISQTNDLGSAIQQSITGHLDGIIRGTTSVKEAFASMLQDMASRLLSSGLDSLFSSIFGGFKVPGFANGVTNFAGGLARINERGGELVSLPSGSTVIPHDLSKMAMRRQEVAAHVTVGVDPRNGNITAFVDQRVGAGARQADRGMNQRIAAYERDPLRR